MFIVQVMQEKVQENLFNVDIYTQTKTTWNDSDWLMQEKATFYWSRSRLKWKSWKNEKLAHLRFRRKHISEKC